MTHTQNWYNELYLKKAGIITMLGCIFAKYPDPSVVAGFEWVKKDNRCFSICESIEPIFLNL